MKLLPYRSLCVSIQVAGTLLLRKCTLLQARVQARVAGGAFVESFGSARCKGYTGQASVGHLSAVRKRHRQNRPASRRQNGRALLQETGGNDVDVPATVGTPIAIEAPGAFTARSGSILASLMKSTMVKEQSRSDADIVLYFAFGANMCTSILVNKRGVQPLASLPVEATKFACGDEKLCLSFCHRAGYATLREMPGPPQSWETSPGAHGVVHVISSTDLKAIEAYENGYRKRLVEVETPAGDRDIAVCFISTPAQSLPTSVPPTSRYLTLLQNGAAHYGVDERYRSWLAQLPSVPSEEEATSPERINTPSKIATDAVFAAIGIAALGGAIVVVGAP